MVELSETEPEPLNVCRGVRLARGVSEAVPLLEATGEGLPAPLNEPTGDAELWGEPVREVVELSETDEEPEPLGIAVRVHIGV